MPKSLVLGNGNLLITFDKYAQVNDFYFPYVGLENHTGGHYEHRLGVWIDGELNWMGHPHWSTSISSHRNALMGQTKAINKALGVELNISDVVYNEKDIFLRKVKVTNKGISRKEIKVYFNHEFEIYESHRGDTAYYDPINNAVIHYNGRRVFLISGRVDGKPFDDFNTGIFKIEGREGSFKDAEDGLLSKNPIEHGPSDSVLGFYMTLDPEEERTLYYWIAAAESIKDAVALNNYTLLKSPEHLLRTTSDFWSAWVNRYNFSFYGLEEGAVDLFKKSLFIIRAHTDNRGAILASGDYSMLNNGRDTYSYMWPRDASYSAIALDSAGDQNVSKRFFEFCNSVITDSGYFMHKYRPDKSLGSSWHPWIRNGKIELPIQEDQTALVIYALWKHYEVSKDLEFIEEVYNSLIKKAADFMVQYRDPYIKLPKPSYDLWEEKFGTSTYTSCAVYGGLIAAANFSAVLGKHKSEKVYRDTAEEIKEAIFKYLYNPNEEIFYKMITPDNVALETDKTIDMSSAFGLFAFGVLPPDDERLVKFISKIEERLACKTFVGGIARYENDRYYRISNTIPGNPWFITSLWLAQYYIAKAKNASDFDVVKKWINWVVEYSLPSGVLSEQLDTFTGEQISAAPLTWSQAEYVITIIKYLDKLESMGICIKCNPVVRS
ncbi:MAG: glycoside hydrolase family 15 protein [bacterium]|nr:glycoside hydrolase family 15 protein [bacterium]